MKFNKMFEDLLGNSNVDKKSIFDIANSIQNADLSDEKVIRNLIRDISQVANRPVSKELEDKLVGQIKSDGVPKNFMDLF